MALRSKGLAATFLLPKSDQLRPGALVTKHQITVAMRFTHGKRNTTATLSEDAISSHPHQKCIYTNRIFNNKVVCELWLTWRRVTRCNSTICLHEWSPQEVTKIRSPDTVAHPKLFRIDCLSSKDESTCLKCLQTNCKPGLFEVVIRPPWDQVCNYIKAPGYLGSHGLKTTYYYWWFWITLTCRN